MLMEQLSELFKKIGSVTVCVAGDICLDAYFCADMRISELSRETPHFPLPVVEERYSLGGGGNVINNASALKVKELIPVSVIGSDWRGYIVKSLLKERGIPADYITELDDIITPCYIKPMRKGISGVVYEDPRLDFENRTPLNEKAEDEILCSLKKAAERADVIAVSDQLKNGVITPKIREFLCETGKTKPVVVDSRERISLYRNVIVKPNEVEAEVLDFSERGLYSAAKALNEKTKAPVIITLGERGAVWFEKDKLSVIPAVKTKPPVDIVGAGDTFLSAFSCAYAACKNGETAVSFANLASAVTIKKIGTTGTADREEIITLSASL